jgi:hypothetical protein
MSLEAAYQTAREGEGGTTFAGSSSAAVAEGEPDHAFQEIALILVVSRASPFRMLSIQTFPFWLLLR